MPVFHTSAIYSAVTHTHVIVMGEWYKACDALGEDWPRLDLCLVRGTGLFRICGVGIHTLQLV